MHYEARVHKFWVLQLQPVVSTAVATSRLHELATSTLGEEVPHGGKYVHLRAMEHLWLQGDDP